MQKMKAIFYALLGLIMVASLVAGVIAVVDAKDDGKSVTLGSLAPVEENCIDDGEEECTISMRKENPFEDVLIIDSEWAMNWIDENYPETTEAKKAKIVETEIEENSEEEERVNLGSVYTETVYSPSYFYRMGAIIWGGYRWTYYSQRVLPGGGLNIPGRYVDENGFVCDGDGYICLAHATGSKGTIIETPFGKLGKVYDACEATYWYGNPTVDVYVDW